MYTCETAGTMSRVISWEEVEHHHGDADQVWTVIHGKVYDMTTFLDEHPGGRAILVENAGLDSSEGFDDVGHSMDAKEMLKDYEIGVIEQDEAPSSGSKGDSWPFMWIPVTCAMLAAVLLVKFTVFNKK